MQEEPIYDRDLLREVHDHTMGFCDLPSLEQWNLEMAMNLPHRGQYRCMWAPREEHYLL